MSQWKQTIKGHSPIVASFKTTSTCLCHPWLEDLSSRERITPPLCPEPDPSLPWWSNFLTSCATSFFLVTGSPSANKHAPMSPTLNKTKAACTTFLSTSTPEWRSETHCVFIFFHSLLNPLNLPPLPRTPLKLPLSKLPIASFCQMLSSLLYLTWSLNSIQTTLSSLASRTTYKPGFSPIFTSF